MIRGGILRDLLKNTSGTHVLREEHKRDGCATRRTQAGRMCYAKDTSGTHVLPQKTVSRKGAGDGFE